MPSSAWARAPGGVAAKVEEVSLDIDSGAVSAVPRGAVSGGENLGFEVRFPGANPSPFSDTGFLFLRGAFLHRADAFRAASAIASASSIVLI
jgi:hypothetical protein